MYNSQVTEVTKASVQKYFKDVMQHPDWARVFTRHFVHQPHLPRRQREKAPSIPIIENSRHCVIKEGALPEVESENENEN